MAQEQSPAFSFYPSDFLSDFDVQAADLEVLGAYALLLSYAWKEDGLPQDVSLLASALHISPKKFDRIWSVLAKKFPKGNDGRLHNSRQEEERALQAIRRAESAEKGRKGAKRRWLGHLTKIAEPSNQNGRGIAQAMPGDSSSSSSSSTPPVSPKGEGDGGRMEALSEHWRACLWKHAHATASLTPTAKEQQHMINLLTRYPDDGLLFRIVEEYIASTDKGVREKPRSWGMCAHWAGEIEGWLRRNGGAA